MKSLVWITLLVSGAVLAEPTRQFASNFVDAAIEPSELQTLAPEDQGTLEDALEKMTNDLNRELELRIEPTLVLPAPDADFVASIR